jgi:Flp pilus assembly protein TadG
MTTVPVAVRYRLQRHPTTRRRDERGAAAIEFLLTAPALLLTLLLLVQWAVRLEAERAVHSAAREAAASAAAWDGSEAEGRRAGNAYVDELEPDLSDRSVDVTRGATTAIATVEGNAPTLIPGLHLHVSATETAPVERFAP